MKKSLFIMLAAATLASCSKKQDAAADAATTPADTTFQVLTDRVIEVTLDTFDFEAGAQYLQQKYDPLLASADTTAGEKMGGCSAIRVDLDGKHYVGRNYDFYCSDAPAVVVRLNAGKYKTLGICNSPSSFDVWTNPQDYQIRPAVFKALPYLCCDVMNEAGLYAETNIRPNEPGLECTSTAPGKPRRCTQSMMQLLLSQYESLEEIEQHLNDYDWFDLQKMGFQQSFFITDRNGESIIIEFAQNQVKWQKSDCNANFYINPDFYALEKQGCGELRIAHEKALLPEVKTEDDIFRMMKAGAYDQFYHSSIDADYAIPEFYANIGYDRVTCPKHLDDARQKVKDLIATFDVMTWEERVANHTWETTFSTVANITDRTLHVHFSEHYGIDFTVGF